MRLDEPPADVQPEAGSRDPRFADVPGAMERFRDERPFRGGDTDPLVIDRDRQPLPVDPRRDADGAVRRPVLERVLDEVLEDLADPGRVDLDRRQVRRQIDAEPIRSAPMSRGRRAAG